MVKEQFIGIECHQAQYKELLANAEYQINRIALVKGNIDARTKQTLRYMKRLLELITNNFNKDLMESPHDFFLRDTSYQELIDCINRNIDSPTTRRNLHQCYELLVNEVLPRYKTKQWVGLDDSNLGVFSFNEDLSDQDRLILCLKKIVSNYYPLSTPKTDYAFSRYLENIFTKEVGYKICGARTFESILSKIINPLFVDDNVLKNYVTDNRTSFYKPLSLLTTIEKLSLCPDGYLDGKKTLINIESPKEIKRRRNPIKRESRESFPFEYLTEDFKKELLLMVTYKTTPLLLDKKRLGMWVVRKTDPRSRTRSIHNAKIFEDLYWLSKDVYVPSLSVFCRTFFEIIAFCIKSKCLPPEKITLFHLADPNIFLEYVNEKIQEKGFITSALSSSLTILSALWNEEASFFVEYSDEYFSEKYNLSKDEILALCAKNLELCNKARLRLTQYVKNSPNSAKVLNSAVCDLPVPIEYVVNILERAEKNLKPLLDESTPRMVCFNDFRGFVLTSCLSVVPLRLRNWYEMRVGYTSEHECIYKKDNQWHLSVPKHCFKNYRQRLIPDYFKYSFNERISRAIDQYMELRAKLNHSNIEYFMVSTKNKRINDNSISTAFTDFTNKYRDSNILNKGLNVHYMRDIVATTFLKKHKGAFGYVSYLLLDSEETVKKHYGHLSPNDAFTEWNNYLGELQAPKVEG